MGGGAGITGGGGERVWRRRRGILGGRIRTGETEEGGSLVVTDELEDDEEAETMVVEGLWSKHR